MSADLPERQELSTDELLLRRDLEWSRQLHAVSLVTEYPVDARHADQTLVVLAQLYRDVLAFSSRKAEQTLRRWPAVQVVSMVNVAIGHYNHGNFWTSFFERAGLRSTQDAQSGWGSAFLDNLGSLGLDTFSDSGDAGTRYVGRVLMHSGIPTYCLRDYYLLIDERRRISANLSPEAFVAWASARAEQGRLDNVDKPVVRFLRYGGDYALDLVDRTFELLDRVAAGGNGSEVPLPDRFAIAAEELQSQGQLARVRRTSAGSFEPDTALHPYLAIDPYGRGPLLRLPAVSDVPDGVAVWQVTIDGQPETVQSRALWPGSAEPVPGTDLPIVRPSRISTACLVGHDEYQSTVPIVDEADPLLAFDEDGKQLSGSLPLPRSAVWVLYPNDTDAGPVTYEGVPRVIATGMLPGGWSGWALDLVDLTDVTALGLEGSKRRHTVRGVQAARVSAGEPVPGLRSSYGSPVYVDLPNVVLPVAAGDTSAWDITITDGAGQVLSRLSATDATPLGDVWRDVRRPLLGSYTVRVRGPWGRGCARRIVMVEGLKIQSEPAWRRFTRGGLVPATAVVRPASGMSVNYPQAEFDRTTLTTHLVFSIEGDADSFQFTPPHMTVSHETDQVVGRPSVQPAQLETESLIENPGTLTVDIGGLAQPQIRVLSGGAIVQTVEPGARAAQGIYRFDLGRMVDTVRTIQAATLSLDDQGEVTVAVLLPRRLTSGVTVDPPDLVFADCRDISGLAASIYALRAPWRPPVSLPVAGARLELPDEYVDAGPLLVSLRVEDPWFPTILPPWPAERDAKLVSAVGHFSSGDEDESALSAFLAGAADFPIRTRRLDRLWITLSRARLIDLADRKAAVRAQCVDKLLERPLESLLALEAARIDQADLPSVLIESGLTSAAVASVEHEALQRLWPSDPVTAALMVTAWLRDLRVQRAEVTSDMIDAVVAQCGPVAGDLLMGRPDSAQNAGRFDSAADRYALMDDVLRDAFRAAMALIPRGLLDADSRTQAAMTLVERRRDPRLRIVSEVAGRLSREVVILLQRLPDERPLTAVEARAHPTRVGGWSALSSLSLGFAIVARQAARGNAEAAGWLAGARPHWIRLARVAPELVKIDIVLAELLCAASGLSSREVDQA